MAQPNDLCDRPARGMAARRRRGLRSSPPRSGVRRASRPRENRAADETQDRKGLRAVPGPLRMFVLSLVYPSVLALLCIGTVFWWTGGRRLPASALLPAVGGRPDRSSQLSTYPHGSRRRRRADGRRLSRRVAVCRAARSHSRARSCSALAGAAMVSRTCSRSRRSALGRPRSLVHGALGLGRAMIGADY